MLRKKLPAEYAWIQDLPYSGMVYPDSLFSKLKYAFWRVYAPYHPFVRDLALKLGIVHHRGRQEWLIGTVAPHLSIREFVSNLLQQGFGNHFIAWKDDGELISLRHTDSFAYQYHLRVFEDREVRAHYEYTPEYHPVLHLKEYHIEPRREYFLNILKDTVVVAE
jgi:hypothetical protein